MGWGWFDKVEGVVWVRRLGELTGDEWPRKTRKARNGVVG
jgi:hypothetical protein